ncbi:NAD(P)H-dependent oxidoreductase [Chitinophaga barathri]|uniref:Flavodoxin family protein n=1 Tax=Chitinophaga barathri TaxID=1647451 RepID=A0A3N4MIX4_9BACT|nr:NAD(P)H-dependent oxidoreductase [Chitinophaga barathri]RPD41996.1 flavodoxin family protein [Chitinophaga barathri]
MKHLIIYAHPNAQSVNHHLKETAAAAIRNAGHEVEVRDLYALGFDPVLSLEDMQGQMTGQHKKSIAEEQAYLNWADAVTFIYPIWWTGMPAIMKGYIDRVMTYGFAYRYDKGVQKGLLKGKTAYIFNTHGKSHEEYQSIGMDKALKLTSDTGIYTYCGFEVKQHLFFDRADKTNAEIIAGWAKEVAGAYAETPSLQGTAHLETAACAIV